MNQWQKMNGDMAKVNVQEPSVGLGQDSLQGIEFHAARSATERRAFAETRNVEGNVSPVWPT